MCGPRFTLLQFTSLLLALILQSTLNAGSSQLQVPFSLDFDLPADADLRIFALGDMDQDQSPDFGIGLPDGTTGDPQGRVQIYLSSLGGGFLSLSGEPLSERFGHSIQVNDDRSLLGPTRNIILSVVYMTKAVRGRKCDPEVLRKPMPAQHSARPAGQRAKLAFKAKFVDT